MERSPAHYQNGRFKILAKVNNDDTFHDFIGTQLKNSSFSINTYFAFLFVLTCALISIVIYRFFWHHPIELFFYQFVLGVLLGIFLVPFHELLHGMYLKILGCISIGFEWNILKFRYSCFSNQFVMSKKEYHHFLITPFIIITIISFFLACVFSQFEVLFLSMLLMHSSMSAGDFALLSFSSRLNRNSLFIYYDNKVKITVFMTDK